MSRALFALVLAAVTNANATVTNATADAGTTSAPDGADDSWEEYSNEYSSGYSPEDGTDDSFDDIWEEYSNREYSSEYSSGYSPDMPDMPEMPSCADMDESTCKSPCHWIEGACEFDCSPFSGERCPFLPECHWEPESSACKTTALETFVDVPLDPDTAAVTIASSVSLGVTDAALEAMVAAPAKALEGLTAGLAATLSVHPANVDITSTSPEDLVALAGRRLQDAVEFGVAFEAALSDDAAEATLATLSDLAAGKGLDAMGAVLVEELQAAGFAEVTEVTVRALEEPEVTWWLRMSSGAPLASALAVLLVARAF